MNNDSFIVLISKARNQNQLTTNYSIGFYIVLVFYNILTPTFFSILTSFLKFTPYILLGLKINNNNNFKQCYINRSIVAHLLNYIRIRKFSNKYP